MKTPFYYPTAKIKKAAFYLPVTVYFVVFVIVATIAKSWLTKMEGDQDSSYSDIFHLLLTVALSFSAVILVVALVSVLISYLFFIYQKRKNSIQFKISTNFSEATLHEKQTVGLTIKPILKPIFGFVKLRLLYDKQHFSDKFVLVEKNSNRLFSNSIEGIFHWSLPEIKEYHIEESLIYFEDFFQFFSIAVALPANNHFFTKPTERSLTDLQVLPRKTEETTTRIEQLRKVEGEYLNYKNFENNDDVRRIVWKIYAKNKELVVRMPEVMDPYASHVYLYASFFNQISTVGNEAVDIPFLNYYKVNAWSIYQNLVKRGFQVRYVPDQELAVNHLVDEQQRVKYYISTSRWQKKSDLKSFLNTNDASLVIISSLNDANEVEELMERHGQQITFIFIKLTDSFKDKNMFDWVKWLFVKSEHTDLERYKRSWALSPMRQRIKENEKVLENIMNKYLDEKIIA